MKGEKEKETPSPKFIRPKRMPRKAVRRHGFVSIGQSPGRTMLQGGFWKGRRRLQLLDDESQAQVSVRLVAAASRSIPVTKEEEESPPIQTEARDSPRTAGSLQFILCPTLNPSCLLASEAESNFRRRRRRRKRPTWKGSPPSVRPPPQASSGGGVLCGGGRGRGIVSCSKPSEGGKAA